MLDGCTCSTFVGCFRCISAMTAQVGRAITPWGALGWEFHVTLLCRPAGRSSMPCVGGRRDTEVMRRISCRETANRVRLYLLFCAVAHTDMCALPSASVTNCGDLSIFCCTLGGPSCDVLDPAQHTCMAGGNVCSNRLAVCMPNMLWPNVCPSAALPEAVAAFPPLAASSC